MSKYVEEGERLTADQYVQIQSTDYTRARLPFLIDSIGVVTNIPTYPNQWYKIKFTYKETNVIIKVPRSALSISKKGDDNICDQEESIIHFQLFTEKQDFTFDFTQLETRKGAFVKLGVEASEEYKELNGVTGMTMMMENDKCVIIVQHENKSTVIKIPQRHVRPMTLADMEETTNMDSFWIGRRVVVLRGKYQGFTGVITRSKATWAQLILDHNSILTQETTDCLHLCDTNDMENEDVVFKQQLPSPMGNDGRKSLRYGIDNTFDFREKKGRKHKSSSSNLKSSCIMWVDRTVMLPDKTMGVVRTVDHGLLLVENTTTKKMAKYRKEELQLCVDTPDVDMLTESNDDTRFFVPEPIHGNMFNDQVKRHIAKMSELLKKRPNIKEWTFKINDESIERGELDEKDESVRNLYMLDVCSTCGVEKELDCEQCWNEACPRCPVFNKTLSLPPSRIISMPTMDSRVSFTLQTEERWISSHRKRRFTSENPALLNEKDMDSAEYRWMRRCNRQYTNRPVPLEEWKKIVPPPELPIVVPAALLSSFSPSPTVLDSSPYVSPGRVEPSSNSSLYPPIRSSQPPIFPNTMHSTGHQSILSGGMLGRTPPRIAYHPPNYDSVFSRVTPSPKGLPNGVPEYSGKFTMPRSSTPTSDQVGSSSNPQQL